MNKSTTKLVLIALSAAVLMGLGYLAYAEANEEPTGSSAKTDSTQVTETQQPAPEEPEANGSISGSFTYPSESIPTNMAACIENYQTKEFIACSEVQVKDEDRFIYGVGYEISVPAGEYVVYVDQGDTRAYFNGYSAQVTKEGGWPNYDSSKCESDYQPTIVTVEPGKESANITLADWYFEVECASANQ